MSKKSTSTSTPVIPPETQQAISNATNIGNTAYTNALTAPGLQFGNINAATYSPATAQMFQSQNVAPVQAQGYQYQGYTPANFSNPSYSAASQVGGGSSISADQVKARQGSEFLNSYLNPYTQQVVDTSLSDFDVGQERATAARALGNAASGAWGDLGAVGDAIFQADALRGRGALSAGLRSNAFNTAAGFGQQDASRFLQGDLANQSANLQAAQFNAQDALNRSLANQAAMNQANLFNAGVSNTANMFNVNNANQAGQFNAGAANQAGQFNAGEMNRLGMFNAGNELQNAQFNANLGQQGAQFNTGQLNQAGQFNAGQGQQANMFNATGNYNAAVGNRNFPLDAYQTYINGPLGALSGTIGQRNTSSDGGSGLLNLGGQLGAAAILASDIRVKKNITRVGTLENGLPIYEFDYVWGGPRQVGLMAQDVEKVKPWAVVELNGIKHVNYTEAVR